MQTAPHIFCEVLNLKVSTRKRLSGAGTLVFIVYMSLVLYFVFFSDHYGRVTGFTEFRYNLTPFAEINRYLIYQESFTWENLITNLAGNILVFAPLGVLIPIIRRKKTGFFYVLFLTLFISLFIETVQLITKVGVFDVDDLIMNTVGGVLGYLAFSIARLWYRYRYRIKYGTQVRKVNRRIKVKNQEKPAEKPYPNPTAKTFRRSTSKDTRVNGRKR